MTADSDEKSPGCKVFPLLRRVLMRKVVIFPAIFCSFLVPIFILFFTEPDLFQLTWKGRTFYLFFLWLIIVELFLSWEKYQAERVTSSTLRNTVLGIVLVVPTVYVVVANHFGLNAAILNLAAQSNVPWAYWVPLSIEYLVFAMLFSAVTILAYGLDGLKDFSISALFLGAIGTVYMIDNLYPYGSFTPFQVFVPTTASLATNVLNFLGYQTGFLSSEGGMPILHAWNSQGSAVFGIAWPCSGIQSFLIYALVILLFLKRAAISRTQKVVYFAIGAAVTYLVNVLRIATIFIIAINHGDWSLFHNYYGELYSMTWIMAYPLIIVGSRMLWAKIKLKYSIHDKLRKLFPQLTPTKKP